MEPTVDARVQQARLAVGDQAYFARICAADDPDQAVEDILREQLQARLDRLEALIVAATDPEPAVVPSPPKPRPEPRRYLLNWNKRAEAAEARWRERQAIRNARDARRAVAEAKREARRIARENEACLEHELRRRRPFVKTRIPMPDEDAWRQDCPYTYDDHNFPVDAPVDLRDDADAFYREANGWALIGLRRAQPFSADRPRRSGGRYRVDYDRQAKYDMQPFESMSDPLYPWTVDVAYTAQRREAW